MCGEVDCPGCDRSSEGGEVGDIKLNKVALGGGREGQYMAVHP